MSSTTAPSAVTEKVAVFYARNAALFPVSKSSLDVGRSTNLAAVGAVEKLEPHARLLFVAAQRDPGAELPTVAELYSVGVVVRVKDIWKFAPDNINIDVEGVARARLANVDTSKPVHMATIERLPARGSLSATRAGELDLWLKRHPEHFVLTDVPERSPDTTASDFVDAVAVLIAPGILDDAVKGALLEELDVDRRAALLMTSADAHTAGVE